MHIERRAEDLQDWSSLPAPDDTLCQNRRRDLHPRLTGRHGFNPHWYGDLGRSGLGLLESNHVAGRVAERAVPYAVRLIHGLLQHLATSAPDVLEARIAILGAEVDATQESLREHLLHDLAVGRG